MNDFSVQDKKVWLVFLSGLQTGNMTLKVGDGGVTFSFAVESLVAYSLHETLAGDFSGSDLILSRASGFIPIAPAYDN